MERALGLPTVLVISMLVALAAAAPGVAANTTRSARYTGGNTFLVATAISSPVGGTGYLGGARFDANGHAPLHLDVTDDTGAPVFVIVCQDLDFDEACGDAGDPSIQGCGASIDITTSTVPFSPTQPIGVLIFETDSGVNGLPSQPTCGGLATSGTIVLRTA